jgi:hypothetical protein
MLFSRINPCPVQDLLLESFIIEELEEEMFVKIKEYYG